MDALATDRREKLPVEIQDHVKMFHFYFYSLEPDDKLIKAHITKALYLADGSAKAENDDLNETGYYSGLQSGNISAAPPANQSDLLTGACHVPLVRILRCQVWRSPTPMRKRSSTDCKNCMLY
jgi:hypothetical protein